MLDKKRMEKCPICRRDAKPRAENPTFPFCSARCKTIDLGKWLSEEYRVPVEGSEEEIEREVIDEEPDRRTQH